MTASIPCPNGCRTAEQSYDCPLECTIEGDHYETEVDYEYEVQKRDVTIVNLKHTYTNLRVEVPPSTLKMLKAKALVDYDEVHLEDWCEDPYVENGVSRSDFVK